LVSSRESIHNPNGNQDSMVCNFLDAPELLPLLPPSEIGSQSGKPKGKGKGRDKDKGDELRVIYRHYATLYFVFLADTSESELGILDLIQVSSKEEGMK